MTPIKGILFDLDGTLLHSALDFYRILNQMLAAHQRSAIAYQVLEKQVSNGARAMIETAFSIAPQQQGFDLLRQEFLERYFEQATVDSCLYPGIEQLLSSLDKQGIQWGVVTNKPAKYTDKIMQHFGLAQRAASVICPDHVTKAKPDPEALLKAAAQMNLAASECLYFGDHLRDIQAGQAAQMQTVACAYGYLNLDEDPTSWQASFLVAHSDEIELFLHNLGILKHPKTAK